MGSRIFALAPTALVIAALTMLGAPARTQAQNTEQLCRDNAGNDTLPCYINTKRDGEFLLYGFNYGKGHGTKYDMALQWGDRYSMDRCALGHDRGFWSNNLQDTIKAACSNSIGFYRCAAMVRPGLLAFEERLAQDAAMGQWERDHTTGFAKFCLDHGDFPYAVPPMPLNMFRQKYAKPYTYAKKVRTCDESFPSYWHKGKHYGAAFFVDRKKGECWSCPVGFQKTLLPGIMDWNKCESGFLGIGGTHAKTKHRGNAEKPPAGAWKFGHNRDYYCPKGYTQVTNFPALLNNTKIGLSKAGDVAPDKDPNACAPTANPDILPVLQPPSHKIQEPLRK